jgi:hypothetical protein
MNMLKLTQKSCGWLLRPRREAWLLAIGVFLTVNAQAAVTGSITNAVAKPTTLGAAVLDSKRLFALGMIETGNNDGEVGAAGEVSRYQILPAVWRSYSRSADYRNPDVSVQVARRHWTTLANYFKERTGREPGDFDMYVLWNSGFGYYTQKGFVPKRLCFVVRDRAQRYANLVNRRS